MLEKAKYIRGYDIEDMTETQIAMMFGKAPDGSNC